MKIKQHTLKQPMGKIKREIRKYFQANKNENTTYQNLLSAAKVVLRVKLRETEPS